MLLTRSHTEEGVPQYKNIPKISFFLRNLLVGHDPCCGTPLSGSYREAVVMELLPWATTLLRIHRVLHTHGFARKPCIIHFSSKTKFLLIISIPQPKYLVYTQLVHCCSFISKRLRSGIVKNEKCNS